MANSIIDLDDGMKACDNNSEYFCGMLKWLDLESHMEKIAEAIGDMNFELYN